jgi:hypothetical protein
MRPGRRCPVCDSDPITLAKLSALRETGSSYREIAALVPGFDVHKIRRHFKHVGKAAAKVSKLSPLEQSERRLAELSQRAEESWIAAAASGDSRAALDVLKASIRLEVDRHARLLEKQEKQVEADSDDPIKAGAPSVEFCDHLLRTVDEYHRQQQAEQQAAGMISCPACGGDFIFPHQLRERMNAIQVAAGLVAPVTEEKNVQHASAN